MFLTEEEYINKYGIKLNEKQLKAVMSVEGPTLLLAVPGSGKTTVLVHRLGYMIFCKGIEPGSILTLTYTIAATEDMKQRFVSVFGEEFDKLLEFRTINGICAKIILNYAHKTGTLLYDLATEEKSSRILQDVLRTHMSEYPTESDVKNVKSSITYCKNMMLSGEEIEKVGRDIDLPLLQVYKAYNRALRESHLIDYDDQMILAYKFLSSDTELLSYYREQYRYICVDEAQDTSKIQHTIIKMLAGDKANLFMVGDEDQSIYGFRAAFPQALLDFEKDHPGAHILIMDQNYRSNAGIVEAADRLIQNNKYRHEKHIIPTRPKASDIDYIELGNRANQYTYLLKVAKDCKRETAVLYRDNESAIPLVDLLDRQGVPFRMKSVDMAFFSNRVVTDVTNIMRFALNPFDTELFMKIYFKCKTYLKKPMAEEMCRISAERHIPVLDAAAYISDGKNDYFAVKCKSMATNIKGMLTETPGKCLFRIERTLGYGEYLEQNGIDDSKLFILKILANNETSMLSYLNRLESLQDMLLNNKNNKGSNFILSTIHSSKGLEYDRVFLMDVCDGVFPNVSRGGFAATEKAKADMEEERRLFYVGVTRAKNDLHIFKFKEEKSGFVRELAAERRKTPDKQKGTLSYVMRKAYDMPFMSKEGCTVNLYEGMRVTQITYGKGTVSYVEHDQNSNPTRFVVDFDEDEERTFVFPVAFTSGRMKELKVTGTFPPLSSVPNSK